MMAASFQEEALLSAREKGERSRENAFRAAQRSVLLNVVFRWNLIAFKDTAEDRLIYFTDPMREIVSDVSHDKGLQMLIWI